MSAKKFEYIETACLEIGIHEFEKSGFELCDRWEECDNPTALLFDKDRFVCLVQVRDKTAWNGLFGPRIRISSRQFRFAPRTRRLNSLIPARV